MCDSTFTKQRDREPPSFANINLLGTCNVDCYFCLGKDIKDELAGKNQLRVHYFGWKNFFEFLYLCKAKGIRKLYITGQNTDSLLYQYLDELIKYLHSEGFQVGLRTNGYLALKQMDTINQCELSAGYSIHTLNHDTNYRILGRRDMPNWGEILIKTGRPRVQIVVTRENFTEFFSLIRWISQFKHVRYIQARRVSSDTRRHLLGPDARLYDKLHDSMISSTSLCNMSILLKRLSGGLRKFMRFTVCRSASGRRRRRL